MKKLFLFFIPMAFHFNAPAQKAVIKGDFQYEQPVRMVFLSYRSLDKMITDSSLLVNGKFQFRENINEPTQASIIVRFHPVEGQKRSRIERMEFFMEPGIIEIRVKDSLKFAKIAGSKSNAEYGKLKKILKPYEEKEFALRKQSVELRTNKDEAGLKKNEEEYERLSEEKNTNGYLRYLQENSNSPIALYVLTTYAGYDVNPSLIEPLFKKLPAPVQNSSSGIGFKQRIETAKKTSVGSYAMEFVQNDTLGKPVALSSFKGKYVLIDFWASWCGPCRAENPNLVKAFHDFKNKGFTVLGVSLDQPGKQQAWLDAIHKDNLTWTQVSDLKGWNNEVARRYDIKAIPQNLLLDTNGKIIAKNIRGEELAEKLNEVFN